MSVPRTVTVKILGNRFYSRAINNSPFRTVTVRLEVLGLFCLTWSVGVLRLHPPLAI